jgi:hypothetical protein
MLPTRTPLTLPHAVAYAFTRDMSMILLLQAPEYSEKSQLIGLDAASLLPVAYADGPVIVASDVARIVISPDGAHGAVITQNGMQIYCVQPLQQLKTTLPLQINNATAVSTRIEVETVTFTSVGICFSSIKTVNSGSYRNIIRRRLSYMWN